MFRVRNLVLVNTTIFFFFNTVKTRRDSLKQPKFALRCKQLLVGLICPIGQRLSSGSLCTGPARGCQYAVEDFSSLASPPYQELDDSRLFAIHLIRRSRQLHQMPRPPAMYGSTPSTGASILATYHLVCAASDMHSKPRRATSPCVASSVAV